MAALTANRKLTRYDGSPAQFVHHIGPVNATTRIYYGAMVGRNATGYLVPMTAATGLTAVGVLTGNKEKVPTEVDNTTGAAGALEAHYTSGTYLFANDGTVTIANIGAECYAADDQTVSMTATGRSVAGRVIQVQGNGVFVKVGLP